MSEKYMKVKKVIIPTMTMIIISSLLFGCAATTPQESFDMLQQTEQIELEYAVPEYDITEDSEVALLPWLQLGSLESHPELRQAFDEYFGITGETGNKEGSLYYNTDTQKADQNVTLFMVLKNADMKYAFTAVDSLETLSNIAAEHYADVEADDLASAYATINAYFELLPDQEAGQFDGDSTISRAQSMALLMRATTVADESGKPAVNKDFTSAVGESQYTDFAAPMNEFAYINTKTGLNEGVFNSAMSRGEYIALLTNYLTENYEGEIPTVELSTITDGGSEITYGDAISDTSIGLPTDLYSILNKAVALGIIDEDALEDWDSSITKAEAVELFVTMTSNYTSNKDVSNITDDDIDNGIVSDEVEAANEAARREGREIEEYGNTLNVDGATGTEKFKNWAKSQGADTTFGWTFIYYNGKGAGNQPSYGVYMKEGPLYGTVYKVGDYLQNGQQFCGTLEEYGQWQTEQAIKEAKEEGKHYIDEETGRDVIVIGD